MFFETHSCGSVIFRDAESISFPAHFHAEYELIYVVSGELRAVIDGAERAIRAGEAALIFPFQTHQYISERGNRHRIAVYSREFVPDFSERFGALLPENPVLRVPDCLAALPADNLYLVRAFIYAIHGVFARDARFLPGQPNKNAELRMKILRFIDENYRGECDLTSLARSIGYDYSYLSKYFTRVVGSSFTSFVNEYRVDAVCRQLLLTDKTVSEIAGECGFGTIRSLNRVFSEHRGMTPSSYRSSGGESAGM